MEIKFTTSMVEAMGCMLKLLQGTLEDSTRTAIPRPEWIYFKSFDRIDASPIRRVKQTDDNRKLERTVEFMCRGVCIASLRLVGLKTDTTTENRDKGSLWLVARIGYFRAIAFDPKPEPLVKDCWELVELHEEE